MADNFFKVKRGLKINPDTVSASEAGDVRVDSAASNALKYYDTAERTVVNTDGTQTLTNKTIDADANTITNIENADIKAAAAISLNKLAAVTVSKALSSDGSGFISASTVTTTELQRLSGIGSTAVGVSDTQTLSNKTFSDSATLAEVATPSTPSSGFGKIYFKSDGFLYQLNDDGTETKVGAGSGGINYITNPDFESTISGWATYADAAGTSPVDGTGGSPTTTFTRSTFSPLRGTANGLITKDAANRQGEGISYDFTIAAADKAKMLNVSFEYAGSANMVVGDSSDVRVWIYDVTNATLIPVTPATIQGGTGYTWKFNGQFQSASNSTSYRLILHVATTNASAWTMQLDTVVVGPTIQVIGAPVTDWQSYTATFTGFGTLASQSVKYRRVGDSIEILGYLDCGTPSGSTASFTLPSGLTIDTSKISATTGNNVFGFGSVTGGSAGGVFDNGRGLAFIYSSSVGAGSLTFAISTDTDAGGSTYTAAVGTGIANAGSQIAFKVEVPITGWGSTVTLSNDTDTRVVAANYYISSASVTPGANTQFNFDTKVIDTHGAVTTGAGAWKFTAPVSGFYQVAASIYNGAAATSNISVYKNGSNTNYLGFLLSGSGNNTNGSVILQLAAGDYIDVRGTSASAYQGGTAPINSYISIQRLSGPATIAASEKVSARYSSAATTSLSTGAEVLVQYDTKVFDSHGAVTTGASWVFTAPKAMKVNVRASIRFGTAGWAATETAELYLVKNGSTYATLDYHVAESTTTRSVLLQGSGLVSLLAGDTIAVKIRQDSGSTMALDGASSYSTIDIIEVA